MDTRSSRYLNILVGLWLFVSAFVLRHSAAQFTNTWVMGIIVAAIAALALAWPAIRYLNTLAGAWLIISAFALPAITSGTRWNNFIVGIVVVVLSLAEAPTVAGLRSGTRAPHRRWPTPHASSLEEDAMTQGELDRLCINTLRFLAVDMVQKASSGHPGMPLGRGAHRIRVDDALPPVQPCRSQLRRSRSLRAVSRARIGSALCGAAPRRLRADDARASSRAFASGRA